MGTTFLFLTLLSSLGFAETTVTLSPGSVVHFKDLPKEGRFECPTAKTQCECHYLAGEFPYRLVKVVNGVLINLETFHERKACLMAKKDDSECHND